jgi:hypothetical protein
MHQGRISSLQKVITHTGKGFHDWDGVRLTVNPRNLFGALKCVAIELLKEEGRSLLPRSNKFKEKKQELTKGHIFASFTACTLPFCGAHSQLS